MWTAPAVQGRFHGKREAISYATAERDVATLGMASLAHEEQPDLVGTLE